jgi:hypothetical protein
MVNTVASAKQIDNVQQQYRIDTDFNNDNKDDILLWDANNVFMKYADQETEHFSEGNNTLTTYYTKFYSYENEHP